MSSYPYAFLSILAIAANLGIGLYVILRNPKRLTNLLFVAMMLTLSLWGLGELVMKVAGDLNTALLGSRIAGIGWCLIGAFYLHLVLVFTKRKRLLKNPLTYVLLYLPSAVFLILLLSTQHMFEGFVEGRWGYRGVRGVLGYSPQYFISAMILIGIFILFRYRSSTDSPMEKTQTLYIIIASLICLLVGLITEALFPFALVLESPVFISFTVAPIIGYAVTREGLMSTLVSTLGESVISIMNEPVVAINSEGNIEAVNTLTLELTGYREAELVGLPLTSLIEQSPDTDLFILIGEQPEFRQTGFCLTKAGERIPAIVSSSDVRNRSGKKLGSINLIRDMTDILTLIQTEQALEKSEAKYRLLAENMADVVWTVDMELSWTYMSPSVLYQTGYTAEKTMDRGFEEVITPESLVKVMEFFAEEIGDEDSNDMDPNRTRTLELQRYTKDGSLLWIESTIRFLRDADGNPVGILGIDRNISERRKAQQALQESEEKHRILAENSTDVIWTMDMEMNWTYLSPAVERQRGYTAEEAIKQSIQETLTPESFELAIITFADELEHDKERDGDRMVSLEFSEYRKDGSVLWTEAAMKFLRGEDGRPVGVIGVTRDITERKEYEEELERANTELDGYTRMVSHDLKNPLATLQSSVELMEILLSMPLDETSIANFEDVLKAQKESIQTSLSIVNDLLILEMSGKPDRVKEVDVSEIIDIITETFKQSIKDNNAVIRVDSNLGTVMANYTHIYLIFTNLIKNSLKHAGRDNQVIEISCLESEYGVHKYLVRDNGSGIDEKIIDRIFMPFTRGAKTGESGIGLSIVEKLVHVYGGEVRAYNDDGACFEFTLSDYKE